MNKYLGYTYYDEITGFTGVCVGYIEYLTGCNQMLLVPKGSSNKREPSEWFDKSRLMWSSSDARILLDVGRDPGCDIEGPKI